MSRTNRVLGNIIVAVLALGITCFQAAMNTALLA